MATVHTVIRRLWRRFLASTRLSLAAVCEESRGLGDLDYHSVRDAADVGKPERWMVYHCKRCGKRFTM